MSNIIDFLEKWGQDAQLRHATRSEMQTALINAGIEPAVRTAILAGDERTLEARLEARSNVCCLIYRVPDDEGDEEADESRKDNKDDKGAQAQHRAHRPVAQEA